MNTLQKRCELLVQNRTIIKDAFRWETAYMHPLCASLYAAKGRIADADAMKDCRDLLKQKNGVFSNFRGISKMATITLLSLSPNPEMKMERMVYIYGKLKEVFWGSEYLTVASATIADMAEPNEYDSIIQKTRVIYDRMKASHPFLTSREDSAFAALLALSGLDDVRIQQEMENCYNILKPSFFSGNAVQSLSHVLALGEGAAEKKCCKVMELFQYLKENGHKYGTGEELATLGVLALLETNMEKLGQEMIEADDYLKTQKGFGTFGIGPRQRMMYAGMMAMCEHIPEVQTMQMAALNGIVSLVIAEQAAICASMAVASAAAAASSNSST